MKNRLNITIDDELVSQAKNYAAKNNTSLSQLIEQYLKKLTAYSPRKKNILDLMKSLPKPKGNFENQKGGSYYEERKSKYGF